MNPSGINYQNKNEGKTDRKSPGFFVVIAMHFVNKAISNTRERLLFPGKTPGSK